MSHSDIFFQNRLNKYQASSTSLPLILTNRNMPLYYKNNFTQSFHANNNSNNNSMITDKGLKNQRTNSYAQSYGKTYSFVAIPGTHQKKRPRRRYDEIERLYHCNWPGCTKSYGTLNHLNAHISMQNHGMKRDPAEFKEMRKEWRRQRKEAKRTSIPYEMLNVGYL